MQLRFHSLNFPGPVGQYPHQIPRLSGKPGMLKAAPGHQERRTVAAPKASFRRTLVDSSRRAPFARHKLSSRPTRHSTEPPGPQCGVSAGRPPSKARRSAERPRFRSAAFPSKPDSAGPGRPSFPRDALHPRSGCPPRPLTQRLKRPR